ncbi:MAG: endonuclease [Flavobacteriales bacterium]
MNDPNRRTTALSTDAGGHPLHGTAVVFYNVENLFDTRDDPKTNDNDFLPSSSIKWTEERLGTKLERLAEAISLCSSELPVLVGLSEVENRAVVEALARMPALSTAKYEVLHFDSPDERGIDVALMVAHGHFEVEFAKALNVDLGRDRTRDILQVELRSGAHRYHVFVNHWPSRREGLARSEPKRMAAARVLAQAVDAIAQGPLDHIIIMGDLNDTPLDNSVQNGLGARCRIEGERLVDLMCRDRPEGTGSHQYNRQWQYLDQFIVAPMLSGEVAEASAVHHPRLLFDHPRYGPSPDKTYSGGHYKGGHSDHLPIVLRFK